jgi:hypothetical protein
LKTLALPEGLVYQDPGKADKGKGNGRQEGQRDEAEGASAAFSLVP